MLVSIVRLMSAEMSDVHIMYSSVMCSAVYVHSSLQHGSVVPYMIMWKFQLVFNHVILIVDINGYESRSVVFIARSRVFAIVLT